MSYAHLLSVLPTFTNIPATRTALAILPMGSELTGLRSMTLFDSTTTQ